MSEKDKKDLPESEPAEEKTPDPAENAPEEEKEEQPAEQETFTVTREQMEKMEALAKLVSEGSDKYLRLAAEYDNYRKRTAKEKENLYSTAKADTIKPFLDVYDNLERALNQFDESDPHRQGMEMIIKQLLDVLAKLGVTEIEALGQPFDPERHNAVMHVEDENAGENTVVEIFQKGFAMGDKVLRFSVVKVAN
jgi:molecular chaperone GrpE